MAETGAFYHPLSGEVIQSDPMREHLDEMFSLADRWLDGLDLDSFTALSATFTAGHIIADGRFVTFGDPVTESLVDNTDNYVYADTNANLVVNQTGITPANAVPLWRLETSGGAVVDTEDLRDRTMVFQDIVKATGGFDTNNQPIVNVPAPTLSHHAVNKQYVDEKTGQKTVRMATTANDTLTGLAARDGVTPVAGDRVLVKAQTTGSQNGIYVAAAGGWARADDADTSADFPSGLIIQVSEGTASADSIWMLTTNAPIVLNTTALTFTRKDVSEHAADTGAVHGATSSPTANSNMRRNASGQTEVADATTSTQAATKGQMDTAMAANAAADRARSNHTGTQAPATISPQGAGSGLDADMVDGKNVAAGSIADTIPLRGANREILQGAAISPKSGGYSLVQSDESKVIHATGSWTLTLPGGISDGFTVLVVNAGGGTITLAGSFTGPSGFTALTALMQSALIYRQGGAWFVVA